MLKISGNSHMPTFAKQRARRVSGCLLDATLRFQLFIPSNGGSQILAWRPANFAGNIRKKEETMKGTHLLASPGVDPPRSIPGEFVFLPFPKISYLPIIRGSSKIPIACHARMFRFSESRLRKRNPDAGTLVGHLNWIPA